jgi:hypothetical protein
MWGFGALAAVRVRGRARAAPRRAVVRTDRRTAAGQDHADFLPTCETVYSVASPAVGGIGASGRPDLVLAGVLKYLLAGRRTGRSP